METEGYSRKKQTLSQEFQSMIDSTLASEGDWRQVRGRPGGLGTLGTLLADLRTSRMLWAWSKIEPFEGHLGEKLLDFEEEKALNTVKNYGRKAISQTLSHWKRQADRLSQIEQIQSAADMIARMNAFSKRFMACTILHNLHKAKSSQGLALSFHLIKAKCAQGNPLKEVSFASLNCFTKTDPSLLSAETLHKWTIQGAMRLQSVLLHVHLRYKSGVLRRLPRRAVATASSEDVERLEFENAELTVNLQNKTNEVNRLVDMLEECKGWEGKLTQIEDGMKTESDRWKRTALELQEKMSRKNDEVASLLATKRAAESECERCKKELESTREALAKIKEKEASLGDDLPSQLEAITAANLELTSTVTDLKSKLQEQIQETLNSEKEKLLLLKRLSDKAPKKPVSIPKKSMQLERPSEIPEAQLALEIVRLNREVNKFKFEARTAVEVQKKAEAERDDLLRQIKVKNDTLEKLRKENDQLSVSLSTDQFKSVHHLEMKIGKLKGEVATLSEQLGRLEAEKQGMKERLAAEGERNRTMETEVEKLKEDFFTEKRRAEEQARALQTLSTLQDRFAHLKEFGDKQILLAETAKREKSMLEEQNESLKASLRSTKLHLDKASADAEAYSRLLKQMESRLADCMAQRQLAEDEVRTLRSRFSKAITGSSS